MKKNLPSFGVCMPLCAIDSARIGDLFAAWWSRYRQSGVSEDIKRIAYQILSSAELQKYWRRASKAFCDIAGGIERLEASSSWLMSCFLQPAVDELHLTGTADRPTRKVRLKEQHKRDRARADGAAGKLREVLGALRGWEGQVQPDGLIYLDALLDEGGWSFPASSFCSADVARCFRSIETLVVIECLAEALKRFSNADSLAEIEEFASNKASWRDYVKAARREIKLLEEANNVEVQPDAGEWQAIIFALTGKKPDPKSVKDALKA